MKHIKQEIPTYRSCVGILMVNPEGKVFIAQRLEAVIDAWQMPQGGIDKDESPEQTVKRELFEETGVRNARIVASTSEWFYYDLPINLIPKFWDGQYRGQRQKWFGLRFLGTDDEINLEAYQPPEFSAWRWAYVDEVARVAVPFKRKIYEAVIGQLYPQIIEDQRRHPL